MNATEKARAGWKKFAQMWISFLMLYEDDFRSLGYDDFDQPNFHNYPLLDTIGTTFKRIMWHVNSALISHPPLVPHGVKPHGHVPVEFPENKCYTYKAMSSELHACEAICRIMKGVCDMMKGMQDWDREVGGAEVKMTTGACINPGYHPGRPGQDLDMCDYNTEEE
jgi:hypothetical protein